MKVSVSLPEEDVGFLDSCARSQSCPSRSADLHKAVRALRGAEVGPAYEDAFMGWEESGNASVWEMAAGDGVKADAPGLEPAGRSGTSRGYGSQQTRPDRGPE